nr:hypothetical protein [Pseudescherichia sp.]
MVITGYLRADLYGDQKTTTAIFLKACGILRRLYIHGRVQALSHIEENR